MVIAYLDGNRFRAAIIAAAQRVVEAQDHLNKINVFPVPDGDTGTNMAITLKHMAERALNLRHGDLGHISAELADTAIMNSRGNSGAIIAQFFQGLATGFESLQKVDVSRFASSVRLAVSHAEQAILNPRNGTILSVMKDWASSLEERAKQAQDFTQALADAVESARQSLKRTPDQLSVLAQAGVVDAGAQGFVHMLEGVSRLIASGDIPWVENEMTDEDNQQPHLDSEPDDMDFQFCTECVITAHKLDTAALKKQLGDLGNSLIVAGGQRHVRIHMHTNDPQTLFRLAQQYGPISHKKTEDIWAQHQQRLEEPDARIALITDSSCDLPSDWLIQNEVRVVPVRLILGKREYLDRITITSEQVYQEMAQSLTQPKTSQPTAGDFNKVYRQVSKHYKQAIGIYLAGQLSGTYQTGTVTAEASDIEQVRTIDSCTVAGGLGHLVMIAKEAINQGAALDEVVRRVEWAKTYTKVYVVLPTLTYLLRSGRLSKAKGWVARLLGLTPIIGLSEQGKAIRVAMCRQKNHYRALVDLVSRKHSDHEHVRVSVVHANAEQVAQRLGSDLRQRLSLDRIPVMHVSPTLGVHIGPGAYAVTVVGFPKGMRPWSD